MLLGELFEAFKSEVDSEGAAKFGGVVIASSRSELQGLQMRMFYTALLQPFF